MQKVSSPLFQLHKSSRNIWEPHTGRLFWFRRTLSLLLLLSHIGLTFLTPPCIVLPYHPAWPRYNLEKGQRGVWYISSMIHRIISFQVESIWFCAHAPVCQSRAPPTKSPQITNPSPSNGHPWGDPSLLHARLGQYMQHRHRNSEISHFHHDHRCQDRFCVPYHASIKELVADYWCLCSWYNENNENCNNDTYRWLQWWWWLGWGRWFIFRLSELGETEDTCNTLCTLKNTASTLIFNILQMYKLLHFVW